MEPSSASMQLDQPQPSAHSADDWACPICLDLLYKPVVNGPCGHIYCFWCMHQAMSPFNPSKCPECRAPYTHFGAACRSLHLWLQHAFPREYEKRQQDTEEEERQNHTSSHALVAPSAAGPDSCASCACESAQEGARLSDHACSAGPHIPASPVVLNCGHAVCGLITPLGLHSCSSPHQLLDACPECQAKVQTAPVVCAKLARLLEQLFPEAYAERSAQLQGKTEAIQASVDAGQGLLAEAAEPGPSTSAEAEAPVEVVNVDPPTPGQGPLHPVDVLRKQIADTMLDFTHHGIGCDSCGMYPIVGQRWRCQDCQEEVGFDMCGDCHSRAHHIVGRFNQQHTASHTMQLVTPSPSLLHLLQATNPELDVPQILSLLHLAWDDQTATAEQASRLLSMPLDWTQASQNVRRRRSLTRAQRRSADLAAGAIADTAGTDRAAGVLHVLGSYQGTRENGNGELILAVYTNSAALDRARGRRASGQFSESERSALRDGSQTARSNVGPAPASPLPSRPSSASGSAPQPVRPVRPSAFQRLAGWFRRSSGRSTPGSPSGQ